VKIHKTTYKDQVFDFIYDVILKGDLKPGDRISETWLSETLKISRAPIREALRQLERDRLVDYSPQIGNFVASFSAKQILDAYVTRGVIEGFAASDAADKFTEQEFDRLDRMIGRMLEAARGRQHYQLANIDKNFHELIYKKCDNKHLIDFATTLSMLLHLIFCKHWTQVYAPEKVRLRHQLIVDRLRTRDAAAIESCIRNHYIETGRLMTQFVPEVSKEAV
jgi:DNA-binding GntR family transcriptional regulator